MGGLPPALSGLVVLARHAKKPQNMGIDKNLRACQDFTVFHHFPAVYISAPRRPIKKP
jgi:hypothetical protein